jgi:hypothetical protein
MANFDEPSLRVVACEELGLAVPDLRAASNASTRTTQVPDRRPRRGRRVMVQYGGYWVALNW